MNRLSTKETVYLIDGCNLIRSAWNQNPFFNFAEAEAEFFDWLDNVCAIDILSSSTFRIIMDGGYRPVKHKLNPAVNIVFTDDGSADDWIVERAYYFKSKDIRAVVISSDRELSERLNADGTKCVPCKKFISVCNKALNEDSK